MNVKEGVAESMEERKERMQVEVVDEGGGCYRIDVPELQRQRFRAALNSPCGVGVGILVAPPEEKAARTPEPQEVEAVAREAAESVSNEEAARLVALAEAEAVEEECPVDPGVPWSESTCGQLESRLLVHLRKKLGVGGEVASE